MRAFYCGGYHWGKMSKERISLGPERPGAEGLPELSYVRPASGTPLTFLSILAVC